MSTIKVKPANGEDDNSYGEYHYEHECIPVGCVSPAHYRKGGSLSRKGGLCSGRGSLSGRSPPPCPQTDTGETRMHSSRMRTTRSLTVSRGICRAGFPLGLENLEKWEGIFQSGKSQGILNRLEKSGEITQNTGKVREFQTNFMCYVIFKWTVYYLLKWIKFLS